MSCMVVRWKPDRAKHRSAASRMCSRRATWVAGFSFGIPRRYSGNWAGGWLATTNRTNSRFMWRGADILQPRGNFKAKVSAPAFSRLYLLAVALVAHFSDGAMRMIGGWPQDEEV